MENRGKWEETLIVYPILKLKKNNERRSNKKHLYRCLRFILKTTYDLITEDDALGRGKKRHILLHVKLMLAFRLSR